MIVDHVQASSIIAAMKYLKYKNNKINYHRKFSAKHSRSVSTLIDGRFCAVLVNDMKNNTFAIVEGNSKIHV